jgi:hypothetical protein
VPNDIVSIARPSRLTPIVVRDRAVVEVVAADEEAVAGVVGNVSDVPVAGAHPPTARARASRGVERRITASSW